MADRCCLELVPQVSDVIPFLYFCSCYARCDARPIDLDAPGSHTRIHERTDFLINNFDPGILWDQHGIWTDIVVRKHQCSVYTIN
jgi:hypothetical protein